MTDIRKYWGGWAPYWSYTEDNFLDLESINKLTTVIRDPTLVLGAGQGLLVEALQKRGLKVDGVDSQPLMVDLAQKRRGLRLICADGANMPFADNSYSTCIVATGVIDWSDDERQIGSIVNETLRVTDDSGEVLVAFYRFHPKVEELMKYLGLITDDDLWCYRRTLEMILKPLRSFWAIKNDRNLSLLSAFLSLIRTQFFLPKKEKTARKNWSNAWKKANQDLDNPEALIECSPEFIPYRNEKQIQNLFKNLNIPIQKIFIFASCIVVQIERQTCKGLERVA